MVRLSVFCFVAGFKWGFPGGLRGPLGLSPTAAWPSGIGSSSTASSFSFSFSFSFSSSSSSDPTSRERGVGIAGVATARRDATLFLLFFCSAAFTAEIAVATAEADFFAVVDLVLRRDFAVPTTGSAPASVSVSSSASFDESDS
jgi:hypothetical protein